MNRAIIWTAILLVAGLALAFAGTQFSFSSNLCLDSADEVRIKNSVLDFSGDKGWVIDAAAGCDNQIMGGTTTLPAENIQTSEGSAERDFSLGLSQFEAWFFQGIQDDRTPVFNVRSAVYDCGFYGCISEDHAHTECDQFQSDSAQTSPAEFRESHNGNLYCYRVEQVGAVSDWTLAQGTDFQGTFTASAGGQSNSDEISKDDVTATVSVGDVNGDLDREHAHITWTGSLAGELRSIDLSGYIPTCDNNCEQHTNEISWTVGDESQYTSYSNYDSGGFENCVTTQLQNGGDASTCVNAYNSRASNVFLDASKGIKNEAGFQVSDVRTQNGQIQVVADRGTAVDRPEFRIMVDADWIGFDIPTVVPRFVSVPEVTVIGNGQTTATVDVKNTGETGEMQVTASCPSPIQGGSDTESTVESGNTARFLIPIKAGPTPTRDYTCTVTAQDTDISSTAVTDQMIVHAKNSCPDGDGDGVCDQFDSCQGKQGPSSNNGCPLKEVCDNSVDDDGDGSVDEGCDDDGGKLDISIFSDLFSGFGDIGVDIGSGFDGILEDINSAIVNPVQNWMTAFDIAVTLLAMVAAFGVATLNFVDPFVTTVANASPLSKVQIRLLLGIVAALVVGYLVYTAISSIVVKALLLVVLIAGGYLYLKVESVVPG